jgi:hypothetical protein
MTQSYFQVQGITLMNQRALNIYMAKLKTWQEILDLHKRSKALAIALKDSSIFRKAGNQNGSNLEVVLHGRKEYSNKDQKELVITHFPLSSTFSFLSAFLSIDSGRMYLGGLLGFIMLCLPRELPLVIFPFIIKEC